MSVQYFDGAENGTLGDFYGEENRADITVIVTEENDKGHNLTVSIKIGYFESLLFSTDVK